VKLTWIAALAVGTPCIALAACTSSNEGPPGPADGAAPFDGPTVDGQTAGASGLFCTTTADAGNVRQ
jgi:hypothetical protein